MKKTTVILILLMSAIIISCSNDDSVNPNPTINSKEYKVQFWGTSSPEIQYPLIVTFYKDNQDGSLTTEELNSQTNTDVTESRILNSYDKLGFKLTVGNGGQASVYNVIITDIESNGVMFENEKLQINTGQTFMYDISDQNYTIE